MLPYFQSKFFCPHLKILMQEMINRHREGCLVSEGFVAAAFIPFSNLK
jgi:hypothetical protein